MVKQCSKCGLEKDIDEFYKHSGHKDRRQSHCKICNNEASSNYYMINKDKIDTRVNQYNKDNAEKRKVYRLNNRGKIREYERQYFHTERGKQVKYNCKNKRRAMQDLSDVDISWLLRIKNSANICPLCSVEMNEIRYDKRSKHIDHIIPINIGGLHMKDNVRFICQQCNLTRPRDGSDINEGA